MLYEQALLFYKILPIELIKCMHNYIINQTINGLKEGIWINFFENYKWHNLDKKIKEQQFKDGKLNGYWREWYLSGQLSYEGEYINGLRTGLGKTWSTKGNLIVRNVYKNGNLELYDSFYKSGRLYNRRQYDKKGFLQNTKSWYEDGQLKYEFRYKKGFILDTTEYNANGQITNYQKHYKYSISSRIYKIKHFFNNTISKFTMIS